MTAPRPLGEPDSRPQHSLGSESPAAGTCLFTKVPASALIRDHKVILRPQPGWQEGPGSATVCVFRQQRSGPLEFCRALQVALAPSAMACKDATKWSGHSNGLHRFRKSRCSAPYDAANSNMLVQQPCATGRSHFAVLHTQATTSSHGYSCALADSPLADMQYECSMSVPAPPLLACRATPWSLMWWATHAPTSAFQSHFPSTRTRMGVRAARCGGTPQPLQQQHHAPCMYAKMVPQLTCPCSGTSDWFMLSLGCPEAD